MEKESKGERHSILVSTDSRKPGRIIIFVFSQISEQIHEQRRCRLPREPGVGAELPPAAATDTPTATTSSFPGPPSPAASSVPRPPTPTHDHTAQDEQVGI